MRMAFYQSIAPTGTPSYVVDVDPMPLSEVATWATFYHIAHGARCVVVLGVCNYPIVMLMGAVE